MKKNLFIAIAIFTSLCSCTSNSNTNANSLKSNKNNITSESVVESSNTFVDDSDINLRKASIIAQDFVKRNFASDCDFHDMEYKGEEIKTAPGRFKVLQKFTSNKQEFVSKIYVEYYGGEWEDINNWDYGNLIIESTATGEQHQYSGNMKQKERKTSGSLEIAGYQFSIKEATSQFIRVSYSQKLSKKNLKKVITELKSKYDNIQICVDPKSERGDEYVCYLDGTIFDYTTGEVVKFTSW